MSKLKIVAILLLLMIGVLIASQVYLCNSTRTLTESVDRVQTSYQKTGNSPETKKKMRQFFTLWQKNSRIFPTIIKHSEIDIVNASVAKLPAYLQDNQPTDFYAECDMLKMQLSHLWYIEKVNWENIL